MAVKKSSPQSAGPAPRLEDLVGEIKVRAFEVYLARQQKGVEGTETSDWAQAEKDIKKKHGIR